MPFTNPLPFPAITSPVMRTTKNFFGLIFAAIPVLWCGGLLLYLNNVRSAFGGWLDGAMGPTMLGLGAMGLLFLLLFLWKLKRYASPPPPPKSGPGGRDAALEETCSGFDPDAAMARYLARRGSAGPAVPMSRSVPPIDRPPPGSFGRKGSFE